MKGLSVSSAKFDTRWAIRRRGCGTQRCDVRPCKPLCPNLLHADLTLYCYRTLVLIATSTLAWGVNFPAHLVIIKGTEYFDGKTKRYVDFPITDVLQMMGRAGRPQFDNEGKAVVMVQDTKKAFYKRFLC
ncbi:activating signal cointegrator 1 complex subunit [Sparganum proliferum]